jgi:pyrroline-5-carboxylate reductase
VKKVGFVGAGNMAGALLKGLLETKVYRARDMWASDANPKQSRALARAHGIGVAPDNATLVAESALVVLAVKPQVMDTVLAEVRSVVARQLFVSIAAGIPTARLEAGLGARARVIRAMPNTPALVGAGITVVVRGCKATAADERLAVGLFGGVGEVVRVKDEALMDAVTGLSGSGPAYVYRFAEGLVAGGIAEGLPERTARQLAYQTIRGAALMMQETGRSPEDLRAMVTSPGGTTLAGLQTLEAGAFAATVTAGVQSATRRARELGRG